MKQLLKGIFKELGIEYQEEHYDKFDTYASLLSNGIKSSILRE